MAEEWFAELYRTSYRRMVLTAYAVTGEFGEAEDIAQEAFAIAYGRRRKVSGTDSPESWLRTVTVNLARRRWRRRMMLDRLLRREQHHSAPPADLASEHTDLHAAIDRLSDDQRAAVVLHYLVDLPVDQVAATLNVPVGTVKSRLSRARTALAAQLDVSQEVENA